MSFKKLLFGLILSLNALSASAANGTETERWIGRLIAAIAQEPACSPIESDDSFASTGACNIFVGRVLERVYGVHDFNSSGGNYLQANDVEITLEAGILSGWSLIGTADGQANLNRAKSEADSGHLVLAVFHNPHGLGHVALIGPGPLTPSSSWKLSTPISASYFIGQPARAYLGKPLAYAFKAGDTQDVKLWVRGAE